MKLKDNGFDYGKLPCSEAIVSFSGGKDSIATYLEVRENVEKVHLVFFYGVPDLEFVEDNLRYFENKFNQKIIRLPQPMFYRRLNEGVYQPPDDTRLQIIRDWCLPNFTREEAMNGVIKSFGMHEDTFTAVGIKASDSLVRRTIFQKHGDISYNQKKFYPIAWWSKQDVIDCLKKHNVKVSSDYKYFKDSFDGLQVRYLLPIKRRFPKDYEKILFWFPLAEAEVLRYEKFQAAKGIQGI